MKFTYACMYAGKTTKLITEYFADEHKGIHDVVIKPVIDDREGSFKGWGWTESRLIKTKIPAYYYTNLQEELPKLSYDKLLIDEAQFMSEEDVKYIASLSLPVHAYGLKTDMNGHLFTGTAQLLAIADDIEEMESLCQIHKCNNKAVAHICNQTSKDGVLIEKGIVKFTPVCYKHWREYHG